MTSEYVPGSLVNIISAACGKSTDEKSTGHQKLRSLFDSSNRFPKKTTSNQKSFGIEYAAKSEKSPASKKQKTVDPAMKILLDREESLRNADEKKPPQKKKKKRVTIQVPDDDAESSQGEPSKELLTNADKAKRRIEDKKGPKKDKKLKRDDSRTVFVGNVAVSVDKKMLLKVFKQCGKIESIRIRSVAVPDLKLSKKAAAITKTFHPHRHNMNAYVVFEDQQSAADAVKLNGTELEGLHIRVDVAGAGKQRDQRRSVFIGNLSYQVEEETLRKHFSDCGEIENVRIVRDSVTGMGKGFGFITFKDGSSVDLALLLKEEPLDGRELRIQRSSNNPIKTTQSSQMSRGKGKPRRDQDKHSNKDTSKSPSSRSTKKSVETSGKKEKKNRVRNSEVAERSRSVQAGAGRDKTVKRKDIKRKARERKQRSLGRLLTAAK